jgi:photosystem II stability/assembly factor-like uncharacterized protein
MSSDDVQLTLWHTTDGGQTWHATPFQVSKPEEISVGGAIFLDFIDSQRGWVVISLPSSSNFSLGRLFRTSDGGATWTELTIPLGQPVRFITPNVGWVAGGPGGNELYVTRDGGATWEPQEVVPQGSTVGYLMYDLPVFDNSQEGLMPVTINDLTQTKVEFYVTHDGGQSWVLTRTVSISREATPNTRIPVAIIDSGHWFIADQSSIPNLPPNVIALDFATPEVGWAYTSNSMCTQSRCDVQRRLMRTVDGGETWVEIELPSFNIYLPLILRNR